MPQVGMERGVEGSRQRGVHGCVLFSAIGVQGVGYCQQER